MDRTPSHSSADPEKRPHSDGSSERSESPIPVDEALEKRVWRKLDLFLLPVVAMFYLLSFLDRTNLGNARVAGLQTDLKMTNNQYSIALTVTYVPYIVAELPSNLLLKVVGPNLMLPTMLTLWGVVTTLQGKYLRVVTTYGGLLACRFFLGMLEGGVFPGLVLYLSFFYPRQRLQWRVSAFFSAASLSGAFSGILAFGIIRMKGVGGKAGWSWIFILEGLFTFLFGLVSFFLLPRSPTHAYFFNNKEKEYVVAKLKEDGALSSDESIDAFNWREVGKAFKLPHIWLLAIVLFCDGTVLYGLAYFAPSIIQGLGYTAARAQLMTVPPFAVAFVTATISAYISDRYRCRGLILIISSLMCVIGFAMFLGSAKHDVQYGSLFFSIPGTYIVAPTVSTWLANNAAPHARRATAIAIGFILTNSGGILATWLLGSLSPAPRYTKATITLLVFSIFMAIFSGLNWYYLWDQNKKKRAIRATMSRNQEDPHLGDKSAWFEYNL
ncbi:MFS general substrate transporter [Macrolepiota fuliginosa MF-IS2]|uniref:MFS general substrate transporter n=1 Tax=Macrolepiota fuliginosa MF-IS2 TaxID=1400762 RepID=A0A9P5X619_9AGAR|nr:MFS general substrate transporter [Macrolepiota fuliginosa MF-IS2]